MILPLRRRHRLAFFALSMLLPVLFLTGLVTRSPLVTAEPVSERIILVVPSGAQVIADARELWGNAIDSPDLLVYWSGHDPALGSLPASAHLVGSLDLGRHAGLKIPDKGHLILYSLAHQRPLAKAPVPKEMP